MTSDIIDKVGADTHDLQGKRALIVVNDAVSRIAGDEKQIEWLDPQAAKVSFQGANTVDDSQYFEKGMSAPIHSKILRVVTLH
tara:strand:+ start:1035 stop:1283 length:249 start_codon:yes stop_codon:yes gene_type:complete